VFGQTNIVVDGKLSLFARAKEKGAWWKKCGTWGTGGEEELAFQFKMIMGGYATSRKKDWGLKRGHQGNRRRKKTDGEVYVLRVNSQLK